MEVDATRLVHLVRSLQSECEDQRVVAEVLAKSGLSDWDITSDTGIIDYDSEVLFVREACTALNDVTFGARAGLSYVNANSINGYIGKSSPDLRAAIEDTSKFHNLLGPAVTYSIRPIGNSACFEIAWKDRSYAKYHRHIEFLLFSGVSRMRFLTKTHFFPLEVRFDHKVGSSRHAFEKLAGFPLVFESDAPEIILSLSSLDLPIPTYDERLHEHLMEYGQRLLGEQKDGDPSLRSRVESLLMASLPGRILTTDEVAVGLGLSARTFARRLAEDGNTYRDIVDALRGDLAKTFMKDGVPLAEIAHSLGYADQAAFSTAFKRWTGVSPGRFK